MIETGAGPAHSGGMPTISELILGAKGGQSYRDMAERAARQGEHIKYQTIGELATKSPKEWPKKPETIRALAAALGVGHDAVILAFARSFGLDVRPRRSLLHSLLPMDSAKLSPDVQRSISELVRTLVDDQHPGDPNTDPLAEAVDQAGDAAADELERPTKKRAAGGARGTARSRR